MVKVNEVTYKEFGRCVRIANELCELHVTLDFGPRVIGYNLLGKENVFKEDPKGEIDLKGPEMDAFYGKGTKWLIRGGHRVWISPESLPESYWPDHDAVDYNLIDGGAVFTPKPLEKNGIAYQMTVTLADDSTKVKVDMTVKNIADTAKTFAVWGLSVMAPGGMEIVPQNMTDTGLLGNRKMSLWPYSDMTDPRVFWGKEYITLIQDRHATCNFKVGLDNENGYALYLNKGQIFLKRYVHNPDAPYPDNNVSFETFTNQHFLEVESLGELKEVGAGDSASHSESWELVACDETFNPKDEKSIKQFVTKFIG